MTTKDPKDTKTPEPETQKTEPGEKVSGVAMSAEKDQPKTSKRKGAEKDQPRSLGSVEG